jgi:hypothetical protein
VIAADAISLAEASALIGRARARRPGDPRLALCVAHLDLARRDYARAARGYQDVLDREERCPEARLGLGFTLASQARLTPDFLEARGLELRAIAQFAAVREREAPYLAALYDRATLLARVGRTAEARARAAEYLARDPAGPWADALRGTIAASYQTPSKSR